MTLEFEGSGSHSRKCQDVCRKLPGMLGRLFIKRKAHAQYQK